MYNVNDIKNKIICGNSKDVLKEFPSNSVDLVVTSPPYYNLRNYQHNDQIGSETTPQQYINNLCDIFKQCKRVLKRTGAIWVNIADSYDDNKSLIGIPERFSLMMQDGLNLIRRNTIVWHKPSCMPSSAKDRFTIDFEYVYFFVKSNETLLWKHRKAERWTTLKPQVNFHIEAENNDTWEWYEDSNGKQKKRSLWDSYDYYFETQYEPMKTFYSENELNYTGKAIKDYTSNKVQDPSDTKRRILEGYKRRNKIKFGGNKYPSNQQDVTNTTYSGKEWIPNENLERIKRTVWSINTPNSTENHFATYPEELIEIPIKACCPKDGLVLDPFLGSGTTAIKAQKLRCSYVGIELNKDYVNIAKRRLLNMITSYIPRE